MVVGAHHTGSENFLLYCSCSELVGVVLVADSVHRLLPDLELWVWFLVVPCLDSDLFTSLYRPLGWFPKAPLLLILTSVQRPPLSIKTTWLGTHPSVYKGRKLFDMRFSDTD